MNPSQKLRRKAAEMGCSLATPVAGHFSISYISETVTPTLCCLLAKASDGWKREERYT
jgi:hypothetical protein